MAKYVLKRKTYSIGGSFTNIKQGVTGAVNNLKTQGNKAVQGAANAWKNTGKLGKAGAIAGAAIGTGLLAKSILGSNKKKSSPQQPA